VDDNEDDEDEDGDDEHNTDGDDEAESHTQRIRSQRRKEAKDADSDDQFTHVKKTWDGRGMSERKVAEEKVPLFLLVLCRVVLDCRSASDCCIDCTALSSFLCASQGCNSFSSYSVLISHFPNNISSSSLIFLILSPHHHSISSYSLLIISVFPHTLSSSSLFFLILSPHHHSIS
jgi:hypothetical protein